MGMSLSGQDCIFSEYDRFNHILFCHRKPIIHIICKFPNCDRFEEIPVEFKRCPFCDGCHMFYEDDIKGIYWISCENCKAMTAVFSHKRDAINAWNRRVNDDRRT